MGIPEVETANILDVLSVSMLCMRLGRRARRVTWVVCCAGVHSVVVLLGDAPLLGGPDGTLYEALQQDQFLRAKFGKAGARLCLLQTGKRTLLQGSRCSGIGRAFSLVYHTAITFVSNVGTVYQSMHHS